jgi:hypothetical protein
MPARTALTFHGPRRGRHPSADFTPPHPPARLPTSAASPGYGAAAGRPGGTLKPEDIRATVNDFFALLDTPMEPKERESALTRVLDRLALAYHSAAGPFDEADYVEPAAPDAGSLRARIAPLFPDLGWYNEAEAGRPSRERASSPFSGTVAQSLLPRSHRSINEQHV